MSDPPSRDYVDDVLYPRTYIPQLAPAGLRLVAGVNGLTPPPLDGFDYCEVGSACGDTLVTLAAANPSGRFLGVEISAAQVEVARSAARRSGVGNVTFLERDLESLTSDPDVPAFDYVTAHGMLSWISPAKGDALFALAAAKLKPGGLFYVGYNVLPGWASVEPLRRLFLAHGGASERSVDRAKAALAFAEKLAGAGAAYFAKNPNARTMLGLLEKAGPEYLVHEYLNAHWHAFYFADVAKRAAAQGLSYVGQIPLYLNVPDLAMPPALKALGLSLGDRAAFDGLKDFAVNELHRCDVYVKGDARRSESAMRAFFEEERFGTTDTLARVHRTVRLPVVTLEYTGPLYDALLAALAREPASVAELAREPKLASFGPRRLADAVMNLALGGQVWPMRAALAGYGGALAHNRRVLADALTDDQVPRALAAPASGTALGVSTLDALCLHVIDAVPPAERDAFVRAFARARREPIVVDDRPLTGEKLARAALRELGKFDAPLRAKLAALGVIGDADARA